jgi:DNA-binding IclR family transcriptional regulator
MRRVDEVGIASTHLLELRDRTRHSVTLAAWGGHGPTIIRWLDSAYPIPVRIRAGTTLPLLASAVGHAFLALPPDVTEPILQRELESGLSQAMPAEEAEHLKAEVRSSGVATTRGLVVLGSTAFAARLKLLSKRWCVSRRQSESMSSAMARWARSPGVRASVGA